MKKIISILLSIILIACLFTACKTNNNEVIQNTTEGSVNTKASDMSCFKSYGNTIYALTERGLKEKNLVIPANFETADWNIFFDNDDFSNYTLESISFGNPNFVIPVGFFSQCYELEKVELPANATSIPHNTFYYCRSLTNISIPENVETIDEKAFYECTSLKEIKFNNKLTTIEKDAFWLTALKKIELPESLTTIGESAFANIRTLQSVLIPESVTSIAHNAFYYSTSDYGERDKPQIKVKKGSWADVHFDEYTDGGHYAEKVTY